MTLASTTAPTIRMKKRAFFRLDGDQGFIVARGCSLFPKEGGKKDGVDERCTRSFEQHVSAI
jgi:hypothetical protein